MHIVAPGEGDPAAVRRGRGLVGGLDHGVVTPGGQTVEETIVIPGILPSLVDRMEGLLGCVEVDMDDDRFIIEGHEETFQEEDVRLTLEWDRFVPAFPPDEDTAG